MVVAHPDDETVFFGGLIADHPEMQWEVVCVTDGGPRALERAAELDRACDLLGVHKVHRLNFPDHPAQRLDVDRLVKRLQNFSADEVYTHGPLGDYGHPHHQDVCLAVHRAFALPIWSVATSVLPERLHSLTPQAFALKARIMSEVYGQELSRFLLILPPLPAEGLVRLSLAEVQELHQFFVTGSCNPEGLVVHKSLLPILKTGAVERSARGFFAAYLDQVEGSGVLDGPGVDATVATGQIDLHTLETRLWGGNKPERRPATSPIRAAAAEWRRRPPSSFQWRTRRRHRQSRG